MKGRHSGTIAASVKNIVLNNLRQRLEIGLSRPDQSTGGLELLNRLRTNVKTEVKLALSLEAASENHGID